MDKKVVRKKVNSAVVIGIGATIPYVVTELLLFMGINMHVSTVALTLVTFLGTVVLMDILKKTTLNNDHTEQTHEYLRATHRSLQVKDKVIDNQMEVIHKLSEEVKELKKDAVRK